MNNQLRHRADLSREKITSLLTDNDPLINESPGALLKKEYRVHLVESRIQVRAILSGLALPAQMALDLFHGIYNRLTRAIQFNRTLIYNRLNKQAERGN